MHFIRIIFLCLLTVLVTNASAQKNSAKKKPEELNKRDMHGKRHGMWLNIVKEDLRGEMAYTEAGSYLHGEKTGLWYKMNRRGDMVAIENYRKDVLDGEVKYFSNGQVTVIGRFRGLNPDVDVDTIMVEDPVTGRQDLVPVKSERGSVRHGTWRYYNERTGALMRVEEYQIDEMIYEEDFLYSKEDSLRFEQRLKAMPDVNKARPDGRKRHSYLNY